MNKKVRHQQKTTLIVAVAVIVVFVGLVLMATGGDFSKMISGEAYSYAVSSNSVVVAPLAAETNKPLTVLLEPAAPVRTGIPIIPTNDILNTGTCSPGETMLCYQNNLVGSQVCKADGVWDSCDTSGNIIQKGSCTPGDAMVCYQNHSVGSQVCKSDGAWDSCDTSNNIIQRGVCTPGDAMVCYQNNSVGSQICKEDGVWDSCDTSDGIVQKGRCTPAEATVCSQNGSIGSQACKADGVWDSCDTSGNIIQKGSCTPGDAMVCTKGSGYIGSQACMNGVWGLCEGGRNITIPITPVLKNTRTNLKINTPTAQMPVASSSVFSTTLRFIQDSLDALIKNIKFLFGM